MRLNITAFLCLLLFAFSTAYDEHACACNATNAWLDVMLVIDNSRLAGADGLASITAFLNSIMGGFTISQTDRHALRVGIIVYSDMATRVAPLDRFTNYTDLADTLRNLQPSVNDGSSLLAGLTLAQNVFLQSGNRGNVRNLYIVATSIYQNDAASIAGHIKESGACIITVAFQTAGGGKPPDLSGLASPGMAIDMERGGGNTAALQFRQNLCDCNCFCQNYTGQFVVQNFTTDATTYYGVCAKPILSAATGVEAQLACQRLNSSLTTVFSAEKHRFLLEQNLNNLGQSKIWIGLNCNNATSCYWYGDSGSGILPLLPGDYINWAGGQPSLSTGNCVTLAQTGVFNFTWVSAPCSNPFGDMNTYFCQYIACDTDNYCDDVKDTKDIILRRDPIDK